jgi:cytochrome c peroxidase
MAGHARAIFSSLAVVWAVGVAAGAVPEGRSATSAAIRVYQEQYRRPPGIPYPSENAKTPARQRLGRMLFFDPRLSGSGWIS